MKNAQINIMQNADDSSSQTGSAFDVGQGASLALLNAAVTNWISIKRIGL